MKQYKIYTKGNYIVIVDVQRNEYFYGIRKEVHIDKSNVDKAVYRAFKVKDFSSSIILAVPNILKENGDAYSETEFDTFYQENTGNFNGGGTAPSSFADLTGSPEDNPLLLSELDSKLDKVSTSGVERAYIINADGSQGTKATSDFKDVLEFANLAAFPVTGETSKIYVALDTNFTYRWSGSAYVQIGGEKRVAICDLGKFQVKVTAVNNFVHNAIFASYFFPSNATGVSNHLLLLPNPQSVIYKVPFDCSLEEICISTATTLDGNISIWKTAPNSLDSTPIELFYVEDDTDTAYKKFTIDSPKILKDSFIHIFFARRSATSTWWSGGFLRFKEI